MFRNSLKSSIAALALLALPAIASAQTLVNDQKPIPLTSNGQSEIYTQSLAIAGGTLYQSILRQPGTAQVLGMAQTFVGAAAGGSVRYQSLTNAKSDPGVPLTATPGTPTGAVGVSRTAGTSLVLTGETTSSSAKTNKAMWELNLADTYVANANIPVTINANYTGGGTVTGASTTLTVTAYSEVNGVETALTVSAAQQFTGTAANYTFTITGTGLVPGAHVVVEIAMLVTTSAGGATGQINSVALTM